MSNFIPLVFRLTTQELILGFTDLTELDRESHTIVIINPVALYEYENEDGTGSYGIMKISPMMDDRFLDVTRSSIVYRSEPTEEVMPVYISFIETKTKQEEIKEKEAETKALVSGNVNQNVVLLNSSKKS